MSLINKSLVVLSILVLSSCVKDFDFDNLSPEKKMVAIANLQPDMPLVINLTETMSISRENVALPLQEVDIKLFEDGIEKDQLEFYRVDTAPYLGYYKSHIQLQAGSRYTIQANKLNYPSITATDTIPAKHKIDNITILQKPSVSSPDLPYKIRFQVYDSPAEGETYYTQAFLFYSYKQYDEVTSDSITQTGYFQVPTFLRGTSGSYNRLFGTSIVSDEGRNGMVKSTVLVFNGPVITIPEFTNQGVLIIHRNVSKTYNAYQTSVSRYFSDENKIFSQPKAVNNNVVNGYGTFQGCYILFESKFF